MQDPKPEVTQLAARRAEKQSSTGLSEHTLTFAPDGTTAKTDSELPESKPIRFTIYPLAAAIGHSVALK